jgi:hypothetical protein
MTSKNKGSIISKKAVAIFPFLLVFSLAILNSCGKSFEEKKQEEGKTTLSPKEKLSLAKDMLETGQVSEAKRTNVKKTNLALIVKSYGENTFQTCLELLTCFHKSFQ